MDRRTIIFTFLAFLISFSLVFISGGRQVDDATMAMNTSRTRHADLVYRVYLDGKSIGIIESKDEFEAYIDKEQSAIKEKYNVDKVFAPKDLHIVKEYTYDEKISTAEDIYKEIKEIKGTEAFTIDGYKIVIEGVEEETEEGTIVGEDQTFYVIDKEVFTESMDRTIKAFVNENEYNNYLNNTQKEIDNTGKIIENLYIENSITVTKERIPTGEVIYTDINALSKYLIFGTNDEQKTYTVQEGDTVEDVSFANKISTEEFLIANTNFNSANDLLYPGQIVTLGILSPQFKTVEEDYIVEEKSVPYETKYENDSTQYVGYERVKQEGQNGVSIFTSKQKRVNGELIKTSTLKEEEVKPSVDKIIVRGTKQYTNSVWTGDVPVGMGSWVWPTNANYTITSFYGWRWGKLHEGIDISGTGYGSPIKAANNGIVVQSGYTSINGNYIVIKHANGYHTMYAHLATRYKAAGSIVYAGDVIGLMGQSGFATGVHLHFAVYSAMPYRGGAPMNPLKTVFR